MELLDLYDVNRNKTNLIIKRGDPVPSGYYRLVVHVCIFNQRNEMLIQQRTENKKWPNKWDITAGGCVSSNYDSQSTMSKELKEELGIDFDFSKIRPVFTFNFDEGFDDFYLIKQDIKLSSLILQKEEVKDARWATMDEILELIKNNEFITYSEELIRLLFQIKDTLDIYTE